jgi:GAF domain-containing protein
VFQPTPRPLPLPGRSMDHYARLVRRLLRVPQSTVSLVYDDEQVFVGAAGLAEPAATSRRTPLTHSFCQYVVTERKPLVVADARGDRQLRAHPAVTDLGVVAYAGWPLYDADGATIGSLCAVEHGPRAWTTDEVTVLQELGQGCSAELQRLATLGRVLDELAALEDELAPAHRAIADRVALVRLGVSDLAGQAPGRSPAES